MSNFRKLLIWQKSMSLITKIYISTNHFPKEEIFGLTSQIRRSSISIPSNIAEGFGRESNKEFLRFLSISIGSLFEMQTQLEIAKNIAYLNENEFNNLYEDSREVERMLVSFIKKLKERN
ncbi:MULTISPECIES: four helix bundle protein [Flavobacterium]|jgi:four helix bundle protein|uniref:Four helix bundle protein n=1 Tax=Flavobacterium cupriresistens TaxID=2893885 RepID=A0ABU4RF16_9FLAO|nr:MULTISPECIES: four helix bundle protein [unclassified Flavobacterium]KLT68283.1 S23 ribosomal protein [Flavobacterium sp. ABG]MDX6191182.1 four helix bundle protein [Flavobacterium sp. Fl-318]UFH42499.1 four helix bundle protein [Flavobacterium sp. F-323]